MVEPDLYAVILAGGFGTRFWPASRKKLPKQFLPIAGRRTMIAETAARLNGLVARERILVVTAREHVALVKKSLRWIDDANILAEPVGRNTAACVAWAAHEIERRSPTSTQIVLPSDHVIEPAARFRNVLRAAARQAAASRALYLLGIRPTEPATGYGYIEAGEQLGDELGVPIHAVARFVEKPDRERAQQFLASKRFLWNSGVFIWSTAAIREALARHAPDLSRSIATIRTEADLERVYGELPSVSVDVGILEKASDVRVLPIDFRWSDVGSWTALPDVHALDERRNCSAGGARLIAEDAGDCITYGKQGELVALIGVSDLIVVHAGKATLVCPRDRAQDVRRIVARLEQEDRSFL